VLAALDAPGGAYNVVHDEPLTKRDFAAALADAAGTRPWLKGPGRVAILFGERITSLTRSLRVSNSRLRTATAWAPIYKGSARRSSAGSGPSPSPDDERPGSALKGSLFVDVLDDRAHPALPVATSTHRPGSGIGDPEQRLLRRDLHRTYTTTEWHLRCRTVAIGDSEIALELPQYTDVLLRTLPRHTFAS
jgi:hypothetical protein